MILSAKQIRKCYNTGTQKLEVLNGVDFAVAEGEIVSIMGPSGCGKSTLLNILGTIDKPDSGDLQIGGENINNLSDKDISLMRNKMIGFVFQFHHLLPEFSIVENLMIPQMISGVNKNDAKNQSLRLLDIFGIRDRSNHLPSEISGGERQRVAVLRSIVNNPKLILADEPTGNLDIDSGKKVIKMINEMREQFGNSYIIATHNPDIALMCDKHFEFREGILIESK